MRVLQIIGDVFVALGLALAGLAGWLAFSGQDMTRAAGQLWFSLDSASLNTLQSIVQRYLHPGLWDNVAVPLLLRPAWEVAVFLVMLSITIGAVLILLPRRWQRNRRHHRMKSRVN